MKEKYPIVRKAVRSGLLASLALIGTSKDVPVHYTGMHLFGLVVEGEDRNALGFKERLMCRVDEEGTIQLMTSPKEVRAAQVAGTILNSGTYYEYADESSVVPYMSVDCRATLAYDETTLSEDSFPLGCVVEVVPYIIGDKPVANP